MELNGNYITISQYAKRKKITREAVLKRVKNRSVEAKRLGSIWVIKI